MRTPPPVAPSVMDELDHNLLVAWNRVFERCRRDPREARRRYERMRAGGTYDRPVRAWCVAVRASDSRINGIEGAVCSPPMTSAWSGEQEPAPSPGRCLQGGGYHVIDPVRDRVAHTVVLDGWVLRELGGPVWLKYPGVALREAAGLLGRSEATVSDWLPVRVGRTRAQKAAVAAGSGFGVRRWAVYEDPATGWGVRYVPCRAAGRGAGMEVPVIWNDGPLDPGGFACRPPFRGWGKMWMSLAERIPVAFEQEVRREPVFYPNRGGEQFKGWHWVCPGLSEDRGMRVEGRGCDSPPMTSAREGEWGATPALAAHGRGLGGNEKGCGRRVRNLYAPLPVWTVGRSLGIEEGLEVEGLSGQWLPGVMDRWAGRRRLACERCWKIRRQTYTNTTGWNELVTALSGGLLYGREVDRPSGFTGCERRRAFKKRRREAGRDEVGDRAVLADAAGAV